MLENLKKIKEKIYNQVQEKSITTSLEDEDIELIVTYIEKGINNPTELNVIKEIYKGLDKIINKIIDDWDKNKNECSKRFNLHCKNLELILQVIPLIIEWNKNLPDKCKIINVDEVVPSNDIKSLIDNMKNRDKWLEHFESKISELEEKISLSDGAVNSLSAWCEHHEVEKGKLNDKNKTLSKENKKMKAESSALLAKLNDAAREIGRKNNDVSKLKSELTIQLQAQNSSLNEQNKKFSDVKAQSKKQVSYAFASFALSVASIGVCLAASHLAICVALAMLLLISFAVGCMCLYKVSTALDNIEVCAKSRYVDGLNFCSSE